MSRSPGMLATERYTADNRAAALVVVADVERRGGEGSGLVRWARMVLERIETEDLHDDGTD